MSIFEMDNHFEVYWLYILIAKKINIWNKADVWAMTYGYVQDHGVPKSGDVKKIEFEHV